MTPTIWLACGLASCIIFVMTQRNILRDCTSVEYLIVTIGFILFFFLFFFLGPVALAIILTTYLIYWVARSL